MKKIKKLVTVATILGVLGTASMVYATTAKTPADVAASVTGKTIEEVTNERTSGKTYGTVAQENGKLDEFKSQMLEQKKTILDERVKDGSLTQEKADEVYNSIKNNQATCDGTGSAGIGKKYGVGFGRGNGTGKGQGQGQGQGRGRGAGACDGSGIQANLGSGK